MSYTKPQVGIEPTTATLGTFPDVAATPPVQSETDSLPRLHLAAPSAAPAHESVRKTSALDVEQIHVQLLTGCTCPHEHRHHADGACLVSACECRAQLLACALHVNDPVARFLADMFRGAAA